jgi:hypothetical protein
LGVRGGGARWPKPKTPLRKLLCGRCHVVTSPIYGFRARRDSCLPVYNRIEAGAAACGTNVLGLSEGLNRTFVLLFPKRHLNTWPPGKPWGRGPDERLWYRLAIVRSIENHLYLGRGKKSVAPCPATDKPRLDQSIGKRMDALDLTNRGLRGRRASPVNRKAQRWKGVRRALADAVAGAGAAPIFPAMEPRVSSRMIASKCWHWQFMRTAF